jgi:cytochrome c-type biogenesis protein CcmH
MLGTGGSSLPATRRGMRALATTLLLAFATTALAVQPDEVLKDPALERRARDISAGLRCLVCQNQSIDDSDAPLAKDLRVLVRERLKAGESDERVRDHVVQRYGEFVLLKPAFGPHTALLWLGPALVFLAGATGLALALRRRRAGSVVNALSPEERAALDAILERDRRS